MRDTVLFIAETKRSERVNERLGCGFFIVSVATKVPVLPTFPRRPIILDEPMLILGQASKLWA
jgi:hypothetical protein